MNINIHQVLDIKIVKTSHSNELGNYDLNEIVIETDSGTSYISLFGVADLGLPEFIVNQADQDGIDN